MDKKIQTYKKLFSSSFYISIFIIGGGYVAIPLLQKRFVEELGWIEKDEMSDLIAISQSSPGSVAVNTVIAIGYKIAGFSGALCALIGSVLPSLILIMIIQRCYELFIGNEYIGALFKGMNCAVAAIMVDVVLTMGKESIKSLKYFSLPLMIGTFVLVYIFNINPAFVVIGCIIIGILVGIIANKNKEVK
ncbi:chromate transporter [Romboutsia sp.]|uniref:chromate transporter n=1 Tax=Romboutsia sp. TaxID=1965302 RepID=UPI003F3639C5